MAAGVFRNRNDNHESLWHLQLTMLLAIALQLVLPDKYVFGSRYVLVTIELLLLAALRLTTPKDKIFRSISRRVNVFLLIALSGIANIYSLIEVARRLLETSKPQNGKDLILAAINIYLTNVIIFAIWYWEMDGGGPGQRLLVAKHDQDFLFPQEQNPDYKHPQWQPTFIDYLYVSSTNAMAFSPTDTMPMSRRAKLLMLLQATASLIVVALIAARAVNILG